MVLHLVARVDSSPGSSTHRPYAELVDRKPWYRNSRLVVLNCWVALLLITSTTNGFDGSMMNGLQSLPQWESDFHNPSGSKLGLLSAIQSIGTLASLPLTPFVSDTYGRRISIFLGSTIMLVGAALQTASQSVQMFIGARFLLGFGLTFASNAAPLLVTEIAYPSLRGPVTSLYNTMWFLGSITASWSTYGSFHMQSSWSWRIPSALQGLPSIIQFCLIFFAPESPRWLISKGRRAEALAILAYYHANGNAEDPLVEYEFEEIKTALVIERTVASNVGWLSFYRTKGNRRRMRIIVALAFFSQWSGNGLLSYYLSKVLDGVGITDKQSQLLINGSLNIFNFICAMSAGLLCERIGRRRLFIASCSSMLVFWSMLTLCVALYSEFKHAAAGYAVVAFIFFFTTGYAIAFTPLIVSYTLEILPFALRAKGFAIFNFSISVSIIFNQYINPIALDHLDWRYYLVYVFWLIFELAYVFLFVVETKDRTLEETAALFDGDDTVAEIAYRASMHAGLARDKSRSKGSSFYGYDEDGAASYPETTWIKRVPDTEMSKLKYIKSSVNNDDAISVHETTFTPASRTVLDRTLRRDRISTLKYVRASEMNLTDNDLPEPPAAARVLP